MIKNILFLASASFFFISCAADFKDINSENGRQSLIDLANDYLTSGNCEAALGTLDPLMKSQWVDNSIRLLYASAYACKGGINFLAQILGLADSSDIWSAIIKQNYSVSGDGKREALEGASNTILQTSTVLSDRDGIYRTPDANLYMILVQLNQIAVSIAPLGNAIQASGKKSVSIAARGNVADKCYVQVAFATISNSINFTSLGTRLTAVKNAITSVCAAAGGGVCSQNYSVSNCQASALLQAEGQVLINTIDNQWSL